MNDFSRQMGQLLSKPGVSLIFFAWLIFWKGWALWRAAGKRQLIWFIILLVANTLGILEILYLFYLNRWDIDNGKLLAFLKKKCCRSSKEK